MNNLSYCEDVKMLRDVRSFKGMADLITYKLLPEGRMPL